MENMNFLFAGYAVIWGLLIGYFVMINRKQKEVEREIRALQAEKE